MSLFKNVLQFGHRLWQLGYFADLLENGFDITKLTPDLVIAAIDRFCDFNDVDRNDERQLYTMLMTQARCALPDILPARGRACKWPHLNVRWYQDVRLRQLPPDMVQAAFVQAYNQWAEVCAIRPQLVSSATLANIFSQAGTGRRNQLDGPSGTLAWSELPCNAGENQRLQQMYDADENWSYDMLVGVACHEIGHALGLDHSRAGNLMGAYYDPRITKPQPGDIQAIIALYGRSSSPTPPTTPSPPAGSGDIVIPGGRVTIAGVTYDLKRVA